MSTTSDAAESGVTIKSGKGYEAMWLTPKGTPEDIKRWVMDMMGFPEEAVAGATPYEVCVMAEDMIQGRNTVAAELGGTVVVDRPKGETAWSKSAEPKAEEPKVDEFAWLVEAIGAAKDEPELKRLWASNKDAFSNASVKDAYVARRDAVTKPT